MPPEPAIFALGKLERSTVRPGDVGKRPRVPAFGQGPDRLNQDIFPLFIDDEQVDTVVYACLGVEKQQIADRQLLRVKLQVDRLPRVEAVVHERTADDDVGVGAQGTYVVDGASDTLGAEHPGRRDGHYARLFRASGAEVGIPGVVGHAELGLEPIAAAVVVEIDPVELS